MLIYIHIKMTIILYSSILYVKLNLDFTVNEMKTEIKTGKAKTKSQPIINSFVCH